MREVFGFLGLFGFVCFVSAGGGGVISVIAAKGPAGNLVALLEDLFFF